MNKLLQSLDTWFKGLNYPRKFTVITIIFVLPIIAFLPLIGNEVDRINRYGTNELFGALYTRPLWKITNDLYLHQALSLKYADGEIEFSEVETLQATIDRDFDELEARQRQEILSQPYQDEVAEFQTRWLDIKASVPNSDSAALESQHQELINDFHVLITRVGEDSSLILDPDLDTYYMMDIVLFEMPENQAWTYEIYSLVNRLQSDQPLSIREQEQVESLLGNIQANMAQMDRKIGVALANNSNGEMEPLIVPAMESYSSQMRAFADFIRNDLLGNTITQDLREQNLLAFQEFHQANQEFHTAASNTLQTGVSARVNSSILRFYPLALVVLASVVVAFLLGQNIMSSISEPLVHLIDASQQLAAGNLSTRVKVQGSAELEKVARAFNEMATDLDTDKSALTIRAKELEVANRLNEKRARNLQHISDISRIISQEQKLDILLPMVTRLVSENFGFYHTGIFLLDENRRYALLQAANSEGGQRMLNRGHRLEVGQTGIVGNVALTGKPRIALDVGADAVFFDNPDLPATRSEMAVPLNVRGETIGVLDVQSTKSGEFTENESNMLGILADQVAITIENSRLFAKTQQALTEVQTLYNQYLQKEWKSFRSESANVGYQQSLTGGKPIETLVESDDIRSAVQSGETILANEETQTEPVIVVPIKLRGQTIGVLNVKGSSKARQWSRDEINMIQSVSERLALALENARLFEETNRRAERERLVSDITGKIRSVNDPQVMIQTAMDELRNALGASRVQIIPQAVKENE
jgi:GAF domain-containing protein/HAMP domain-containing protein